MYMYNSLLQLVVLDRTFCFLSMQCSEYVKEYFNLFWFVVKGDLVSLFKFYILYST